MLRLSMQKECCLVQHALVAWGCTALLAQQLVCCLKGMNSYASADRNSNKMLD